MEVLDNLTFDQRDRVAVLTLNRPDNHNAIDNPMLADLHHAFDLAESRPELLALIITGAGKVFCSGGDVNFFKRGWEENSRSPPPVAARRVLDMLLELGRLVTRIRRFAYPVIAAVNGPAVGGGFGIAMACDMRIASTAARLGVGFGRMGASGSAMGISYILPRLVGISRAMELMTTGAVLSAQEAREAGIVNRVTAPEQLLDDALALGVRIAQLPPMGLRTSKFAVNQHLDATFDQAISHEAYLQTHCLLSQDHYEGIMAFLEKREPQFRGE